ncbi:MAG: putative toxin-antitoxin system toxin component, PIN family [Candidatus Bathyarchaeota archaeon]|nr:putative toxin-antitoxin system toxin component, PIN family [Candidatus Termiticorpusculum sp.]
MQLSKKHVLKIVLDTNVWVSALIWGGKPATIVESAEQGRIDIFVSESIVEEISRVLNYPKIEKVYYPQITCQQLMEQILKSTKFVETTTELKIIKEHPADDKIIECAVSAKADYIVSGDKHLLNVVAYQKTQILPVNEFMKLIE